MLTALGKPVWDATPDDVDRVVGAMAAEGLAASTRRGYVQVLKGFHRFLMARRAVEIEAAFGVRLSCPVDEFNASWPSTPYRSATSLGSSSISY
jgi:site-specific recombinase XerD